MSEFTEYPKMLYRGKQHHIVHTEDEEAAKTEEGWSATPAPAEAPAPEQAKESAPCAKCAELQAEVDRLAAALAEARQPMTGEISAPTKRGRPAKA
jgi:hypothetical protein